MSRNAWSFVFAFVLMLAACTDSGPAPSTEPTTVPTAGTTPVTSDAALLDRDGQIGCLALTAYAAANSTVTADKVAPCSPDSTATSFKAGSVVTTDAVGEAYILFPGGCKVHVFRNTTLQKSECPKGGTGGQVCVTNGTAAVDGCLANAMIGTPSATITLDGTWVSVSYVPDLELTQVDVLEGSARVTPVTDIDSGDVGSVVTLTAGESVYTATDDFLLAAEVLDLEGDAREPVPTLDLYLQGLDLSLPYVAYVPALSQAADDGVLDRDLIAVAEDAPWVLRISTSLQEADPQAPNDVDAAFIEAVERGVDWASIAEESGIRVFTPSVDSLLELSPLAADGTIDTGPQPLLAFTQLETMRFDLALAQDRVQEMVTEPDVVIIVSGRSRLGRAAAEEIAGYFDGLGLVPSIQSDFASDADALAAHSRLAAAGIRVISITQR